MALALVLAASFVGQLAPDSPASVARAFALMNEARAKHGLPAYRPNILLGNAAEMQSQAQARRGRMGHDGNGGPFARIRQAGYRGRASSENVGFNQQSAEQIVRGWMTSPGHRAAILSRTYTEAGIACEMGTRGPYWTATFGDP